MTTAAEWPAPGTVPISVLVPTRDEADEIDDCLATVAWAREVAVLDSHSTDDTRERAAAAGATVWTRDFDGYGNQKNWGLERLAHDWALCLDADERVTPELARAIAALFAAGEPSVAGYWIERRNFFLGRPIRRAGWGGERVLRLFRRDRGRFDRRRVHEQVVLDGTAGRLPGALLHYSYRDWDDCTSKLVRYARAGADELFERGRRAGPLDVLLRPPARFLRMYLLQGGWLEGAHGVALCGLAAAQSFLRYGRLWRYSRGDGGPGSAR